MTEEGTQQPIVGCHHCGTAVRLQDAQAITIEQDGEIRVWTPERADYYDRYGSAYAPAREYLCLPCDSDLWGNAAQDRDGAGE